MLLTDARIVVVDSETTGFDAKVDRVCEVGWCTLVHYAKLGTPIDSTKKPFQPREVGSQLIDPGIPIPPVASAVHHLTDRDVKGQPALAEFWPQLLHEYEPDLLVAHNAAFDSAFLDPAGERPWLCTWRLARHWFPDVPSHKNQVLRYVMGFVDVPGDAHRAGHDAAVTAMILCRLLNEHGGDKLSVEQIIDTAEAPIWLGLMLMNFGKHKDKTWLEVSRQDPGYLDWMRRQGEKSERNPDGWDRDQWYTLRELKMGRTA